MNTQTVFIRRTTLFIRVEMSKKEKKKVSTEEIPSLEKDLYKHIEKFFSDLKKCQKTGSTISSPISFGLFGGIIYPDVYGIKNPESQDFEVFMGEGKRDLGGRNFDICKGQGISLQRFADYVYLFFPMKAWNGLEEKERKEIDQECRSLKLGLILVDGERCEEQIPAIKSTELLEDQRKSEVRDLIVEYFPSFSSEKNIQFFEQFSELARNITGECNDLLTECSDLFRKQIGKSRNYTYIYYDKDKGFFQISYQNTDLEPACQAYLTINPFGHFLFEEKLPLIIIEQWFTLSDYAKRGKIEILLKYCNDHMGTNSKIELKLIKEEPPVVVENTEQLARLLKSLKHQIEDLIIYQPIKVSGREKNKIKDDVRKSLSELDKFLKSQIAR